MGRLTRDIHGGRTKIAGMDIHDLRPQGGKYPCTSRKFPKASVSDSLDWIGMWKAGVGMPGDR
jgi:hypothetical protein